MERLHPRSSESVSAVDDSDMHSSMASSDSSASSSHMRSAMDSADFARELAAKDPPRPPHPPESVAKKLAKTSLGGVATGAAVVAAAGLFFVTGGLAAIPIATWLIGMAIGGGAGFAGHGLYEAVKRSMAPTPAAKQAAAAKMGKAPAAVRQIPEVAPSKETGDARLAADGIAGDLARKKSELDKAQAEHKQLIARFAPPDLVAAQARHEIAKRNLERFKRVGKMKPDYRKGLLSETDAQLATPGLGAQELDRLRSWKAALEAHVAVPEGDQLGRFSAVAGMNAERADYSAIHFMGGTKTGGAEPIRALDALLKRSFVNHPSLTNDVAQLSLELELRQAELSARGDVEKASAGLENSIAELAGAADHVKKLEREHLALEKALDDATRVVNLRRYKDLEAHVVEVTEDIRGVSKRYVELDRKIADPAEDPDPGQVAERDRLSVRIAGLEEKFKGALLNLERFDDVLDEKYRDHRKDPFPAAANTPAAWAEWGKSWFITSPDVPKRKSDLLLQYHLARNGKDRVAQTHWDTLMQLSPTALAERLKNFTPETLPGLLAQVDRLALERPATAREVAANLMHTYRLLYANNASVWDSVKTTLERRTAYNYVTDAYLGEKKSLLARESMKPISKAEISLVDAASWAPYVAGAYSGAHGRLVGGHWAQSMTSYFGVPFVGALAGAVGGVAQVEVEKRLADRVTRQQEVLFNSVHAGLSAWNSGAGWVGAVKAAGSYHVARTALQKIGDLRRAKYEGSFKREVWKTFTRLLPESLGEGLAQLTVGSIAAGVAGFSAVAAGGALAWPIAVAVVAGLAGMLAVKRIGDWLDPSRAAARLHEDTRDRLSGQPDQVRQAAALLTPEDFHDVAELPSWKQSDEIKKLLEPKIDEMELGHERDVASSITLTQEQLDALKKELAKEDRAHPRDAVERELERAGEWTTLYVRLLEKQALIKAGAGG